MNMESSVDKERSVWAFLPMIFWKNIEKDSAKTSALD